MLKKILLSLYLSFTLFSAEAVQPTFEEKQNTALLIQEIRNIGGKSANGTPNATMLSIAIDFAQECATNFYCNKIYGQSSSKRLGKNMISHVGFKERARFFPGHAKAEILASCTARNGKQAGQQLARQWFKSPGHKAHMMPFHKHYAYAVVRTDKIPGYSGPQWFAVGLFAD